MGLGVFPAVSLALTRDKGAVGVIEAKPKDWGHKITTVED